MMLSVACDTLLPVIAADAGSLYCAVSTGVDAGVGPMRPLMK